MIWGFDNCLRQNIRLPGLGRSLVLTLRIQLALVLAVVSAKVTVDSSHFCEDRNMCAFGRCAVLRRYLYSC